MYVSNPLSGERGFSYVKKTRDRKKQMEENMLREYFTQGTGGTRTGESIGVEIETDFTFQNGCPITTQVTDAILGTVEGRPVGCVHKLELGRQKIELSVSPQPNFALLEERILESLAWLYQVAERHNAYPRFEPEMKWDRDLLYVQEERDSLWVELDGKAALEHLCRCSSVQFTVAVNPSQAIALINELWRSGCYLWDYRPNFECWYKYMSESHAGYRPDRFGGPPGFMNLNEYVRELERHEVRMHNGQPVRLAVDQVDGLNIDLFLRSVWWHYRLRRYGDKLTIEIRPFARRSDQAISKLWRSIAYVIGL